MPFILLKPTSQTNFVENLFNYYFNYNNINFVLPVALISLLNWTFDNEKFDCSTTTRHFSGNHNKTWPTFITSPTWSSPVHNYYNPRFVALFISLNFLLCSWPLKKIKVLWWLIIISVISQLLFSNPIHFWIISTRKLFSKNFTKMYNLPNQSNISFSLPNEFLIKYVENLIDL